MKGYKAFDKNLKCRGMQYEIGKVYEMDETPIPCDRGFHFCKTIADCYGFYPMCEDTRICEVEATGDVATDDDVKYCTNRIMILAEVEKPREKSNVSESSSGYCNSGNCNSGNRNSGYCNSGNWNSGNRNSGDCNSGNWNSGNRNSGNRNSGYCNSGYCNSGDWNSGDCNSGNRNSGNWNSGDWNSGDWNSGDCNSGIFCTDKNPKIKLFDVDSDLTMRDWINSRARMIMNRCPYTYADFISAASMTDEEKKRHPEHKTIGGFVKVFVATTEDKQRWWDDLPEDDKAEIYKLPNFNAEKFEECVGVKIRRWQDD